MAAVSACTPRALLQARAWTPLRKQEMQVANKLRQGGHCISHQQWAPCDTACSYNLGPQLGQPPSQVSLCTQPLQRLCAATLNHTSSEDAELRAWVPTQQQECSLQPCSGDHSGGLLSAAMGLLCLDCGAPRPCTLTQMFTLTAWDSTTWNRTA